MQREDVPVIAIDGPSASGKGTIADRVAHALGFHYLDSGALYRVVALAAARAGVDWDDESAIAELAQHLPVELRGAQIVLAGEPVTHAIRAEAISAGASRVAALPSVRRALLARQRDFRQAPGLVADGRDMASVVFPDAVLKVFLDASLDERAARRHKQLIEKGLSSTIESVLQELGERDERDRARSAAPLQILPDAELLDTTSLTVDEAVAAVLTAYRRRTSQPAMQQS